MAPHVACLARIAGAADAPLRVCPLCGAEGADVRYQFRTYAVCACARCAFLYNDRFRGGGGEDETFSRDYFLVRHHFLRRVEDYRSDLRLPMYERRLAALEARLGRGRLLDVGPGLGTFLRLARDRGWRVEGVEISEFAVDHVRRTHGIEVFCGGLEAFPAVEQSFDLITFWDSLEHVGRPRQNLETAFRLLRRGGLALLTTDIFDCLIADVARLIYRLTGGRVAYPVERIYIDRNLSYFTQRSFRGLLSEVGFRELLAEKMEYPLGKIAASSLERVALAAFYAAAAVLHRQAQLTVIVERP
jgi:SAM-dependent methyltransferase